MSEGIWFTESGEYTEDELADILARCGPPEARIPAETVEAAARVYRDQQAKLGYPKWEDLPEDGREWRRGYMRAGLEAAAPHLTERAYNAGHLDGMNGAPNTNPYRPTL